MAGTYFNNDNATSVAMDVFKGVLEDAGKPSTDEDLEDYGGLNDQEFLCEYVTKEADAGARVLGRAHSRRHALRAARRPRGRLTVLLRASPRRRLPHAGAHGGARGGRRGPGGG